jgi:hypothetical protein
MAKICTTCGADRRLKPAATETKPAAAGWFFTFSLQPSAYSLPADSEGAEFGSAENLTQLRQCPLRQGL